ncbi:MAG: copper resistance protein CopC [Actinomycetales bacterium]|nr:copper resistance protein CopC [Actinomycetales bacterium]
MTIRRRIFALLASASLLAIPFTAASPALAHDEVIGTTPASGETVAAGAFEVSVTSGEDIMNMPDMSGNQIFVSGPNGGDMTSVVSLSCIKISGAVASVPVDIERAGEYTVSWQLVSQDGHTTDGSFNFNVTNDNGYQASGNTDLPEGCAPLPMVTAIAYDGTATPEARDVAAPATKDDGQWIGLLIGIGFVVVGSVAGVVVVWFRERAKRDKELMAKLAETDPEL